MKPVLSISHSTGDTQVALLAAREFAKRSIPTTLLAVGQAASTQLKQAILTDEEKRFIKTIDLDMLLPEDKPVSQNALNLTASQMKQISSQLKMDEFSGMIVGTPSYVDSKAQCAIPEQMLSEYAPHVPSAVISDYAFFDPEHSISKSSWFKKANKLLVPFKKAVTAFNASPADTVVVGHPSIDALKDKFKTLKKTEIAKKLGIEEGEKLIFVAGGKAGDEALISALAEVCKHYKTIKIKIGVHPAATEQYYQSLQKIIDSQEASAQMVILPPKFISTEECVYAADGVMTVSSTVGTTAALCGKLAGFYQEGKRPTDLGVPYVVGDLPNAQLYDSAKDLTSFFDAIVSNQAPENSISSAATNKTAAENIVETVLSILKK